MHLYFCDDLCVIEFLPVHLIREEPDAVQNIFGSLGDGNIPTTRFNDDVNSNSVALLSFENPRENDIPSLDIPSTQDTMCNEQSALSLSEHSSQGEWII